MGIKGIDRLEKPQIRALAAERIKAVFEVMKTRGEGPVRFSERMGLEYNAFKNSLTRKSFSLESIMRLADNLDISMDFLCGFSNNPATLYTRQNNEFWDALATLDKGDNLLEAPTQKAIEKSKDTA